MSEDHEKRTLSYTNTLIGAILAALLSVIAINGHETKTISLKTSGAVQRLEGKLPGIEYDVQLLKQAVFIEKK